MKKYIKSFLITASILSAITFKANAEVMTPPNVKLEGNAQGIFFIPGEDPFLCKYGMMPGDTILRDIVVENDHPDEYDLYMRAEKITPDEKYDLIRKLNLTVTYEDKLLYQGDMSGEPKLKGDIYLGSVKPGEKETLKAKVYLDGSATGNEYKNKFGQVNWIFTAVKKIDSSTMTSLEGSSTTNENGNSIGDNTSNKLSKTPYTGDSGLSLYIAVGGASILLLLLLIVKKRKPKQERG